MKNKINMIDLFCGAGGLTKGFHDAGFNSVYAVEFNEIYSKSYSLNFPNTELYTGDIKKITDIEIERIAQKYKVDIIVGGPPCQGFSIAGNIGRKFLDDPRNHLFMEYYRFVKIINPKIFVIENVAALVTHNKGRTIKEIINVFNDLGYKVCYTISKQDLLAITTHILIKIFITSFKSYFKCKIFVRIFDVFEFKTLSCFLVGI